MNYIDEGNPANWDVTKLLCKECNENERENMDEYCDSCFPCYECGERTDCDCIKEEKSLELYCKEQGVEVVNNKLRKKVK